MINTIRMKKGNRILITAIAPEFNLMNRYSAVASVIYSFASLLSKEGHDVYVNEHSMATWEAMKVKTETVESSIASIPFIKYIPKRLREFIKDRISVSRNRKLKNRILQIPKPDIIISWVTSRNSYAVDFKNIWKAKLISIYDNPLTEEYKYLNGFNPSFTSRIEFHEKRSIQRSNALVLYSTAVKDYLISKYPIHSKIYYKAFTDFKRMSFKEYNRDTSIINFAYIGSFFNWHKIDDLIEVFQRVNKKYSNSRLYLIGNGPEFNRIHSQTNDENIIFTGRKDGKELDELMEKIHVGIISFALWFHAPVKFFQYSAAKLVVISLKTPTILELSQNNDCYMFFESKSDLENNMTKILDDPSKIDATGELSRRYVAENFSEENYKSFFNDIIENL